MRALGDGPAFALSRVMTDAHLAPALRALSDDVGDLIAALHLLASAALERADSDAHGALRLLARHGERLTERLEELQAAATGESQ